MTGKDVMSDVDSLAYVVLSEAEKHVPYGECKMLQPRCRTKRGHFNGIKLYLNILPFLLVSYVFYILFCVFCVCSAASFVGHLDDSSTR